VPQAGASLRQANPWTAKHASALGGTYRGAPAEQWSVGLKGGLAPWADRFLLGLRPNLRLLLTRLDTRDPTAYLACCRVDVGRLVNRASRSGGARTPAYYCEYVALAEELVVPLVSADRQLLRAFLDRVISQKDFVAGARKEKAT
jgi:hypothetical protein